FGFRSSIPNDHIVNLFPVEIRNRGNQIPDHFRGQIVCPRKTEYAPRCLAYCCPVSCYDVCFHAINFVKVYRWLTYAVSVPTSSARRTVKEMLPVPDLTDTVQTLLWATTNRRRTVPNPAFRTSVDR